MRRYIYISGKMIDSLLPQVPPKYLRRHGVLTYFKQAKLGATFAEVSFASAECPDPLRIRALQAIEDHVIENEFSGSLDSGARFVIEERLPARIYLGCEQASDEHVYLPIDSSQIAIVARSSASSGETMLFARGSVSSLVGSQVETQATRGVVTGSFPASMANAGFGGDAFVIVNMCFLGTMMPLTISIFAMPYQCVVDPQNAQRRLLLATALYAAL